MFPVLLGKNIVHPTLCNHVLCTFTALMEHTSTSSTAPYAAGDQLTILLHLQA